MTFITKFVLPFSVKELQEYVLASNVIDDSMYLLNNSAGRHVLIFADIKVQARFSFGLYYNLHNGKKIFLKILSL